MTTAASLFFDMNHMIEAFGITFAQGLLAATLGAKLRLRLRLQLARPSVKYATLALLLVLGGFAVAETLVAGW